MDATETRKRPYNDDQDGGHPIKRRGQGKILIGHNNFDINHYFFP